MSMIIVSADYANAADTGWTLRMSNPLYIGKPGTVEVYNRNDSKKKATIFGVTSSNPVVAYVYYDVKTNKFRIQTGKVGKTTITVNYAPSGGRPSTFTQVLVVKKYPNHIRSLKVNGKKVKIKGSKRYAYTAKVKNRTKINVRMALKNGWTIDKVTGYCYKKNDTKGVKISGAKKKVKKGKTIKFPKKYYRMSLVIMMKKGKNNISYTINLYR
jgi:hypothetical protein